MFKKREWTCLEIIIVGTHRNNRALESEPLMGSYMDPISAACVSEGAARISYLSKGLTDPIVQNRLRF